MSRDDETSSSREPGRVSAAPGTWGAMARILVAMDGSPSSVDALSLAIDLARCHRSRLVVVHVVPLLQMDPTDESEEAGYTTLREPTSRDHDVLNWAAAIAADHGVTATGILRAGSAADEIL